MNLPLPGRWNSRSSELARSAASVQDLLGDSFPDVEVVRVIGCGRRCLVVAARNGDRDIVVKLYRKRAIARHERLYGGSLAEFEYEQNLTFRRFPEFGAFSARPIGFSSAPQVEIFLQERVFGEPVIPFLHTRPAACRRRLIADLRWILERAGQAGIFDLDLHHSNIIVRRSKDGILRPVLFDFNKVPYRARRSSGVLGWCRRHGVLGYRSDDYRHLQRFEQLGRKIVEVPAGAEALYR